MSRTARLMIGAGAVLIAVILPACSSTKLKSDHDVFELIPSTLRMRRPETVAADPRVGPGGIDYRSERPPNERFDCEVMAALYREMSLEEIRVCLDSPLEVPLLGFVTYRLRRANQPYWELEDAPEAPACIRKNLSRIPVPREIIFQSQIERRISCYSSRIDIEQDEMMGVKVPFLGKQSMKLPLPISREIGNDPALLRLLSAWSVTPFWKEDGRFVRARLVPDAICRKCLGEKGMVVEEVGRPPHQQWPSVDDLTE